MLKENDHSQYYFGAPAFLPLFCFEIVILPLFFLLCEFTPMISKRSNTLPLFRHPPLTVLNFVQKDRNDLLICPCLLSLFVILPLIWELDIYICSNIFGTTYNYFNSDLMLKKYLNFRQHLGNILIT